MRNCLPCARLDRAYAAALAGIHRVVNQRFDNPGEKIRSLWSSQNVRDAVLKERHSHKQSHKPQSRRSPSDTDKTRAIEQTMEMSRT